jgi:hypothetical protein
MAGPVGTHVYAVGQIVGHREDVVKKISLSENGTYTLFGRNDVLEPIVDFGLYSRLT